MANLQTKGSGKGIRFLPPTYFGLAATAMILLHLVFPAFTWLNWPWVLVGLIPIIIGATINVMADAQFKRQGTTIKPSETSSVLVTGGLFRYSRNPMYLGMATSLLGLWVLLGSITPLVMVALFEWWINVRFIAAEEEALTKQYGQAYLDYKSRVRRWI